MGHSEPRAEGAAVTRVCTKSHSSASLGLTLLARRVHTDLLSPELPLLLSFGRTDNSHWRVTGDKLDIFYESPESIRLPFLQKSPHRLH